jgi:hypothetical protein
VLIREDQRDRLVEAFKAKVTENLYSDDGKIKKENDRPDRQCKAISRG